MKAHQEKIVWEESENEGSAAHAKVGNPYKNLLGVYAGPLVGPRWVIEKGDAVYPEALRDTPRPPARLYGIGNKDCLENALAIIGARKATPYGLGCARRFAYEAARKGIVVVSGGAYGCDSASHRGALEAGGKTVVVLGGGCNQPYPKKNIRLFQEIIDARGAVISEHDWDEPPLRPYFRSRNRIIAGLAQATLVVEAGLPSGTFSTADEALNANRDVLVVPGSITSPTSAGANYLIAQGATPIIDGKSFDTACTVLFGVLADGAARSELESSKDPLLLALTANPMRIEEMLGLDGLVETERFDRLTSITIHLGKLEREGKIARYPDGRYGPLVGKGSTKQALPSRR